MFDQLSQFAQHAQNLQQYNPVQHFQEWVPQVNEHLNPNNWLIGLSS